MDCGSRWTADPSDRRIWTDYGSRRTADLDGLPDPNPGPAHGVGVRRLDLLEPQLLIGGRALEGALPRGTDLVDLEPALGDGTVLELHEPARSLVGVGAVRHECRGAGNLLQECQEGLHPIGDLLHRQRAFLALREVPGVGVPRHESVGAKADRFVDPGHADGTGVVVLERDEPRRQRCSRVREEADDLAAVDIMDGVDVRHARPRLGLGQRVAEPVHVLDLWIVPLFPLLGPIRGVCHALYQFRLLADGAWGGANVSADFQPTPVLRGHRCTCISTGISSGIRPRYRAVPT